MATAKLTILETAERLGVTDRTVTNHLAKGMPHEGVGNKRLVYWPEARVWWDEMKVAEGKNSLRSDVNDSKARQTAAQAEMLEIDLAERRREVVSVEDSEAIMADAFMRVRSKLLNLPNAIGMRVTAETLPGRISQAQALVDEVMAELAAADEAEVE